MPDTPANELNFVIVDDDEADIFFAEYVLKKKGASSIRSFDSGADFLDAADDRLDCDVLFMDIRMPNMDGFETLSRIRPHHHFGGKAPRIFVLSAASNPEDIERVRTQGLIEDILQKPLTNEVLQELVG